MGTPQSRPGGHSPIKPRRPVRRARQAAEHTNSRHKTWAPLCRANPPGEARSMTLSRYVRFERTLVSRSRLALVCTFVFGTRTGGLRVVQVNVDNFRAAETALMYDNQLGLSGGVNQWFHYRVPTSVENQPVIRMNRDTLYSGSVVDISGGGTITMPEVGDRYQTVMVINQRPLHQPCVQRTRHLSADRRGAWFSVRQCGGPHLRRRQRPRRHRRSQPAPGQAYSRHGSREPVRPS